MTTAAHTHAPTTTKTPDDAHAWPKGLVVDLGSIDLTKTVIGPQKLEFLLPHRSHMAQLDSVIWHSPDHRQGVALKHVKHDEFWVEGHFPGRPMLPGVLQVEAGAQLACVLYNARLKDPLMAAFTRIENCSFRNMVAPGDDLYLLCQELKWSRRGFTCHIQGVANRKLTFDAQIQGLAL